MQRGYPMEENNREKVSFTENKEADVDTPHGI